MRKSATVASPCGDTATLSIEAKVGDGHVARAMRTRHCFLLSEGDSAKDHQESYQNGNLRQIARSFGSEMTRQPVLRALMRYLRPQTQRTSRYPRPKGRTRSVKPDLHLQGKVSPTATFSIFITTSIHRTTYYAV